MPRTPRNRRRVARRPLVPACLCLPSPRPQGRRRLIVEVDDIQLRYNSPHFCHEAMAEFVELLVLPLITALENLNVS